MGRSRLTMTFRREIYNKYVEFHCNQHQTALAMGVSDMTVGTSVKKIIGAENKKILDAKNRKVYTKKNVSKDITYALVPVDEPVSALTVATIQNDLDLRKRLRDIETWAIQGLDHEEIAQQLGITSLALTLQREINPSIDKVIYLNRPEAAIELEYNLYKAATGYDFIEKSITQQVDSEGNTKTITTKTSKRQAPNIRAATLLLQIKRPDKFNVNATYDSVDDQDIQQFKDLFDNIDAVRGSTNGSS